MKNEIPVDLKKIRTKLRSYERKFRESPHDRDGSGVRFLMGPYYLCLNNLEGAIVHYDWFWDTYPDSIDEPFHTLGQIITKLRHGQEEGAQSLLKRLYASNPYLLPHILDIDLGNIEIPGASNWEENVLNAPKELYSYLSPEEIKWLRGIWSESDFSAFVRAYNNIQLALKGEPIGEHRRGLIDLRMKLISRDLIQKDQLEAERTVAFRAAIDMGRNSGVDDRSFEQIIAGAKANHT